MEAGHFGRMSTTAFPSHERAAVYSVLMFVMSKDPHGFRSTTRRVTGEVPTEQEPASNWSETQDRPSLAINQHEN